MQYWPVAVVKDNDNKAYTMFTYDSSSNQEEAKQWLETVKKNTKVLISYIYDNNKKIVYYDTIFDKFDNVSNAVMAKGKYYARSIIYNDADESYCRWFSYESYNNEQEAQKRIEDVKSEFKTLFDYIETVDENGSKAITHYENNVDIFGNVKYWDQSHNNAHTR